MRRLPLVFLLFTGGLAPWLPLPAPRLLAAQEAEAADVKRGLLAPDRASREKAAQQARDWARTDPAGVAALFPELDLRGRAELLRALAGAGTEHAAKLALAHAGDKEDILFHALVAGLARGGAKAIFTDPPEGVEPGERRRRALEELRVRWKVEEEFARLKSRSGRTGHYEGQYEAFRPFGKEALEIFWAIVRDRSCPLPGDAGSEPYEPLHPGMLDFERDEMRVLSAYAFGELAPKDDVRWVTRLRVLFEEYFERSPEDSSEREEIAPALAFSLYDLGDTQPARTYIARLHRRIRHEPYSFEAMAARWDLGYAYMRIGDPEKGERWYGEVIQMQSDVGRGVACYNLACHFAVRAAREPKRAEYFRRLAVDWLRTAIEQHNFIDWVWMEEDGDLRSIRREREYQRLLKGLQERYPGRKRHRVEKDRERFLKPR